MVYCVGLTGSIASGKTTIAKLFRNLDVDVINADDISRNLTAINQDAYKKIVTHFGTRILLKNKDLNRKLLRTIIFSNADERKWLEQLLHPLIRDKMLQSVSLTTSPYCIVEIPLLVDKQPYPYINKILLITAPQETQIMRVMERDNCSKEQAEAILRAQPDMALRLKHADDIITNNSEVNKLVTVIKQLHNKYLHEAKKIRI